MLEQIFSKGQQPYTQSPVTNVLEDFAIGLSTKAMRARRFAAIFFRLKQTLEGAYGVTAESRFSPEDLAALFALPAANAEAQKRYRHTQHRFERFLSARGHLLTISRNHCFATLLNAYRDSLVNRRSIRRRRSVITCVRRCRLGVALLYSAGLRRGELVRLTLADLNEAQLDPVGLHLIARSSQ